ncbi:MAG: glycosyltransferase family 4 protein [Bacteroidales bacterium]|nr:glycosyltransferase family 4 protein [Bacteroidales bacterium]
MKIIHICQYYNDGYGYQENLLPKYQKKLGHDVKVITSDRMSFFSSGQKPKIVGVGVYEDNGFTVHRIPILGEFKGRFVFFKGLRELLEEEKPDYLFHHGITAPSIFTCAKYKAKNSSVFLVADHHAEYCNSARVPILSHIYYRLIWTPLIRKVSNHVDVFFSITPGCKAFAEKELSIPENKHKILYLGSDTELNKYNETEGKKVREQFGIKSHEIVAITAGKFDEQKKLDSLIKAFRQIDIQQTRLMILGSFLPDDYEKYIDDCIGKDNRIIKVGWVQANELFKYFSASDFAVFPGGQSAVWQQAISCELPLIIKHWPGTEYLLRKDNGLFLFSDKQDEIVQALKIMICSKKTRRQMRENAKIVRDEVLSYEVIATQTLTAKDNT